jgi:gas vesicle protein
MKSLDLLLAIGGGIAVGVVVGLMIAPDEGTETRRKVAHFLKTQKRMLKEELEQFLKSKGIDLSDDELSEIFERHEQKYSSKEQ